MYVRVRTSAREKFVKSSCMHAGRVHALTWACSVCYAFSLMAYTARFGLALCLRLRACILHLRFSLNSLPCDAAIFLFVCFMFTRARLKDVCRPRKEGRVYAVCVRIRFEVCPHV